MADAKTAFDGLLADAKEAETADHQFVWEAAILSTLAVHANSDLSDLRWLILGRLDDDDFRRTDHRSVFRAIKALSDEGHGVDQTTVDDWLKTNAKPVAEADLAAIFGTKALTDVPLVQTYLDRIAKRGLFRNAAAYVADVQAELKQAETEADTAALVDLVGKVQAVAFDVARTKKMVGETKPESELVDGFLLDLETRQSDRGFVGLDSGFSHLNAVLNGLGQGLFVFAGSPSSGKTTYLKQLVDQVAEKEGVPVLFFSFEQSAEELRIKSLARLARVNSRDILKGRTEKTVVVDGVGGSVRIWDRVEKAAVDYRKIGKTIRIVEAGPETTVGKIRVLAQAAKQQAKTSRVLIVVDYLQIVPVSNARDFPSMKDRVDFVCSELRRLARDLDSPVIAISSENREAYKGNARPTLAAFKESGGVEYSADVGAAFWTDPEGTKAFQANATKDRPDHCRAVSLFVMKNRNGELAEIKMVFHPDLALFRETDRLASSYTDSLVVEDQKPANGKPRPKGKG